MKTYLVSQYEESPVEPKPAAEFSTLAAARKYAKQRFGGKRDATLAGERYEDGTRHVEAFYANEHQSSGCWITVKE